VVRYKIDAEDPSATDEPEKNREIGVTLSVTPTLLPDGTVRMKLRPRVAKIVELIAGRGNNVFPRVSESTVEAISRIPAGQSLFLGGFYDYSSSEGQQQGAHSQHHPAGRQALQLRQQEARTGQSRVCHHAACL
jgi:type II secretory pathway component GspD/PulD (secretin)